MNQYNIRGKTNIFWEENRREIKVAPIMAYFSKLEDPRSEINKLHPLETVVAITILAVMSFAKGWEAIQQYAEAKKEWLSKFLDLTNGVPSDDVYRRVFSALKPETVEECFVNWVREIKKEYNKEVIAIDGKTVRGSFNKKAGNKAIHLVSAWATENKLVFGQVKTTEHSNEITAIPTLLEKIVVKGCIVTIDAMGCQYDIANKIIKRQGDYLFSLKGNQGTLLDDVAEYWSQLDFNKPVGTIRNISFATTSTHDEKHGRIEDRDYAISDDVEWLIKRHPLWKTIKSIGMVESRREISGESTIERRYFISSLSADSEQFAHAVRAHWGIENSLHYVLDVVFGEDACRIKTDNGPENMATIRKIALTVARADKDSKSSLIGRVRQMAWSDTYCEKLLFNSDYATV
jgi:predicted transposase YbfD/YdcC